MNLISFIPPGLLGIFGMPRTQDNNVGDDNNVDVDDKFMFYLGPTCLLVMTTTLMLMISLCFIFGQHVCW
jgi:hypothetical protein